MGAITGTMAEGTLMAMRAGRPILIRARPLTSAGEGIPAAAAIELGFVGGSRMEG
jgi:hypothetical protein